MRARRVGNGAEFRLMQDEREIGSKLVVARSGILARLLDLSAERPDSGRGFEVELYPAEAFEIFALGRARVMWPAPPTNRI